MCFNCHDNWNQVCIGCSDGSVHLIDITNITSPEVITLTKPGMSTSEITQYNSFHLYSLVFHGIQKLVILFVLVLLLVMLLSGIFVRKQSGVNYLIIILVVSLKLLGHLKMAYNYLPVFIYLSLIIHST